MDERRRNGRSRKSDFVFAGAVVAALAVPLALVAAAVSVWEDDLRAFHSAAQGTTWTLRITVSL